MRASWGCVAAITALTGALLTSCGGSDTAETATPATPQQAVQDGIQALVDAGTAGFTSHVELGGLTLDQTGTFTVQPQGQRTTDTVTTQGQSLEVEIRGVDGEVYVSLPDTGDPTDCFLTGDAPTMAALSGVDVAADDAGLPRVAVVAASAQGESTGTAGGADTVEGPVEGTVDLADVVALVGTTVLDRLGLAPGDQRVSATLRLDDGALTGFEVDGSALNDAAAEAGTPGGDQAFPDDAVIEARFTDLGEPVDIAAPAAGDLVSVDQDNAGFDSDADACRAG